jgi:hypothetical protein
MQIPLRPRTACCASPQVSHRYWLPMDSLGTSPGKISGIPLTRPNIAKEKLTHLAAQWLQSLHGLRPLGKIPKELCVKITLSIDLTFCPQCLPFPRTYLVCGTTAYACLPPDWRGICTLALLTPQINIIPNNQPLPIPLADYTQSKRAIENHSPTSSHGDHHWNRYRHWGHHLISPYLS